MNPTQEMIKRLFLSIAISVATLIAGTSSAAADVTRCDRNLQPGTYDTVLVPKGKTCRVLGNVTVEHNVILQEGASLTKIGSGTFTVNGHLLGNAGGLLAKVRDRGMIVCGVNPQIPGFGFLDTADNTFKGFDPDFCRVLAAAVFGDSSKIEFRPIAAAADRFPALASGDIDVLIRNTTFTYGRDTKEGADFGTTTH